MGVLEFEKPPKKMSTEEWKALSADGAPPGVYTPNMSYDDRRRFKAKQVGGEFPRIEVRVSLPSECVIKVLKEKMVLPPTPKDYFSTERKAYDALRKNANAHGQEDVKISLNGPLHLSLEDWDRFKQAVDEAIALARG